MPVYNLIEYSSNYSETRGSFIQRMKQLISMHVIIMIMIIIINLSNVRLSYEETLNLMKNWNSKKCNNFCAIEIFK